MNVRRSQREVLNKTINYLKILTKTYKVYLECLKSHNNLLKYLHLFQNYSVVTI